MRYDAITWLPVAGGLSAVLLVAAFFAFRKRGASAGLRLIGWAALPMAIWLTELSRLLFVVVAETVRWVGGLVVRPTVWVGIALFVLWFVLLGGVGIVRRRRRAKGEGEAAPTKEVAATTSARQPAAPKKAAPAAVEKGKKKADDDPLAGFEDIDEILKRRGIS